MAGFTFNSFSLRLARNTLLHYCLYSDSPTLLHLILPRPPAHSALCSFCDEFPSTDYSAFSGIFELCTQVQKTCITCVSNDVKDSSYFTDVRGSHVGGSHKHYSVSHHTTYQQHIIDIRG